MTLIVHPIHGLQFVMIDLSAGDPDEPANWATKRALLELMRSEYMEAGN